MSTPTIGVLALQGDVREHVKALADAGALARPVRRPEELDEIDGLVRPGGESTTMSKLAIATVSMNVYYHADAAAIAAVGDDYLLGASRSQVYESGFFDCESQLWHGERLVATTQRIRLVSRMTGRRR